MTSTEVAAKNDFEYQLSQLMQEYRSEIPSQQMAASLTRYAELAFVSAEFSTTRDRLE